VGSTFRFTVVARLAKESDRTTAADARLPRDPAGEVSPDLRILVAEDNATNQFVIRRLLERIGCAPVLVDSGARAVEAVRRDQFDVVFMDVMMPEMDGLAATRAIRRLPGAASGVRIVALTANATSQDEAACRAAGMDDYVSKPVTRACLTEALLRAQAAISAARRAA
ncbi:MAG TPA: response regulator, partial [Beijerinckiaceae bacterium]